MLADTEINDFINDYLLAKYLFKTTEDPQTQRLLFEKLGLYENPELHLRLEAIFAECLKGQLQEKK